MTSTPNLLKPMFLPGVEGNPQTSPYLDAINAAKASCLSWRFSPFAEWLYFPSLHRQRGIAILPIFLERPE